MMTVAASLRLSKWKRLSWPHPEWWSLCLCVAAWILILWKAIPMSAGMDMAHGHHHQAMTTAISPNEQVAWTAEAFWWLVMVAAMMLPIVRDPIHTTAERSLWRRRHRAIGGFLLGYLGPWMLFGLVASAALFGLRMKSWLEPTVAAAIGFGVAVLWQLTTTKRRAVLACHRTLPIAPTGWRADRDCMRYGWMVGSSCIVSCWALMLACMLAGHGIPAMVCATAVGWSERNKPRPNQLVLCAVMAAFALTYAIATFM